MRSKPFLLLLCGVVVVAILVLAASLQEVRFQPALQLSAGPSSSSVPVELPPLHLASDAPLWKLLLFWLVVLLNLVAWLWLIPPEVRKRFLRQTLRLALLILALVLALRYRLIQLPRFTAVPGNAVDPSAAGLAAGSAVPLFHLPQVSPWTTYLASMAVLLTVFVAIRLIYRWWQRTRSVQSSSLQAIADIARVSLREIASGRNWGDVITESYVRMSDVVSTRRGFRRAPSATPREFAERLTHAGLPAEAVTRLTQLFEAVRYGGRAGSESDITDATDCLNVILRACGAA